MSFTFTADKSALSAVLASVSKVANPSFIALFGYVHVAAEKGKMYATGSDGDVTIQMPLAASTDDHDAAGLLPRVAIDYIAKLPAGLVTVKIDNATVAVTSGRRSASFTTAASDDYTKPSWPETEPVEISGCELAAALDTVLFAASSDTARAVLTGVLFEADSDKLTVVATDTYRLSAQTFPLGTSIAETRVVVPAKALSTLRRFLVEGTQVKFSADFPAASFVVGDVKIRARLVAGDFPKWSMVMPSGDGMSIEVDSSELSDALSRLALLSRDKVVRFTTGEGVVTLSAAGQDIGNGDEVIDATISGAAGEAFALNAAYLSQALGVLGGNVTLTSVGGLKPIVLSSAANPDLKMVQMPIRV